MTGRTLSARLEVAVEHVSAIGGDDRAMRALVLDAIRRHVPFEAHAFLLTDPVTTVGCSPVAEVPDLSTLPDLIRLKYLTLVNRWTGLPSGGCVSLQQATGGRPEQSLLWREHLADLGILDVASLVFTDRFGCWGFLDLWRRDTCFSADEVAALSSVGSSITSLLRAAQAATFTIVQTTPTPRGPGALILSPGLAVRAQTAQTRRWMSTLLPGPPERGAVPAGAYNVAAQLLAVESELDVHPAQARVHLGGGVWLTLRADRIASPEPVEHRDIVVTMEESTPTERQDIFARAHGLTGREVALLGHLTRGLDTRTTARLMAITEYTVQDHLKAMFQKTATSSRRDLLAKTAGR